MASEGERIAEARRRVSDLAEAVRGLGPAPGAVTTMIDSANLRRQADHLEASNRVKSEAIAAYAEYAGMLERALLQIAEAQRQISAMAVRKKGGAARAKASGAKPAGSGKPAKKARSKPAKSKKAARAKPAKKARSKPAGSRKDRARKPARKKAVRPKPARKPARPKPARVRKAAPRRRR